MKTLTTLFVLAMIFSFVMSKAITSKGWDTNPNCNRICEQRHGVNWRYGKCHKSAKGDALKKESCLKNEEKLLKECHFGCIKVECKNVCHTKYDSDKMFRTCIKDKKTKKIDQACWDKWRADTKACTDRC